MRIDPVTLIIDSNFLAHQAKHSVGELSHEELRTGIVFGFLSRIIALGRFFETNDIIFCWDSRKSYRRRLWKGYKNRVKAGTPEEQAILIEQMKRLRREVLPRMGFKNQILQAGIESDDLMASVVYGTLGEFIIVTSDQDLFQCLRQNVRVYLPNKQKIMTRQRFIKEYDITPGEWVQVKTIGGCTSDTIPGVRGVGEQSAIKYLKGELNEDSKKFQDIVFYLADEDGSGKMQLNRKLVKLPYPKTKHVNLTNNYFDFEEVQRVFIEHGFESFLTEESLTEWRSFLFPKQGAKHAKDKSNGLSLLRGRSRSKRRNHRTR